MATGKSPRPHFLVTAGNTREKIDAVRDWGNIFTVKTGLEIALALLDLGNVTLLTSNLDHAKEFDGYSGSSGMLGIETFHEHAQLQSLLAERLAASHVDATLMTAAVSDYKPAGAYRILSVQRDPSGQEHWLVEPAQSPKIKSTHDRIAFLGLPTAKIIDMFRTTWNFQGFLVKFKLEVAISEPQLIQIAQASRKASGANLIVANTLAMVAGHTAQDAPPPGAYILGDDLCERISRPQLATRLRDLIAAQLHL